MLHKLDIILYRLQFLLEEALLLANRLDFKPVIEQVVQLIVTSV